MRKALAFVASTLISGTALADVDTAMARAKSGDFDAAVEVRCAQEVGEPLGSCVAGAAHAGKSTAVVVTFPNGFARTLTFRDAEFLRGNATMSGVGTDTAWRRTGGTFFVRVDDQRFELPDALVIAE